uniref:Uncharacterized protein n=1 Tax=Rhizophora mucronata TaxID=61149 RepID=A0A2P2QXI7_RHIMU
MQILGKRWGCLCLIVSWNGGIVGGLFVALHESKRDSFVTQLSIKVILFHPLY